MTAADLYTLAEDEQIGIYAFDLGRHAGLSIQHDDWTCDIALNMDFIETAAEETCALGHEMGHCMTGSFYNRHSPYDVRQRHENRANRWAFEHICPYEEMLAAARGGCTTVCEMAEHFNVTEDFIKKAYEYYTGPCGLTFWEAESE